jgi:hypothetical protein
MLKVQQTITNNPCFLEEAGGYLVANGFARAERSHLNGNISFTKGDLRIIVYGDNVDFLTSDAGEPDQRNAHYSRYMAHTGIGDLDLFKWMLLFHIANVVPLKRFIEEARKVDLAGVEGFTVQIFDHFGVTDNHNAVPVNY